MSDTTTIRVSHRTRERLRELAETRGSAMSRVLDEAVEAYRRELFVRSVNEAYGRIREDANATAEMCEEQSGWDGALLDGLEDDR